MSCHLKDRLRNNRMMLSNFFFVLNVINITVSITVRSFILKNIHLKIGWFMELLERNLLHDTTKH